MAVGETRRTDSRREIVALGQGGGEPAAPQYPADPSDSAKVEVERFEGEGGRPLPPREPAEGNRPGLPLPSPQSSRLAIGFATVLQFLTSFSLIGDGPGPGSNYPYPWIPEGWGIADEFPDLNMPVAPDYEKGSSLGLFTGLACVAVSCVFFALGRGNISPAQARTAGVLAMVGFFGTTAFATMQNEEGPIDSQEQPVDTGDHGWDAQLTGGGATERLRGRQTFTEGVPDDPESLYDSARRLMLSSQVGTGLITTAGCLLGACLLIYKPQLAREAFVYVARV